MQIYENVNGKIITVRPSTISKRNIVRSDRPYKRAAKAALEYKLNKIIRREMEEELSELLKDKQQMRCATVLLDFAPPDTTLVMAMRASVEIQEQISQEAEPLSEFASHPNASIERHQSTKPNWWFKQGMSFVKSLLFCEQPVSVAQ